MHRPTLIAFAALSAALAVPTAAAAATQTIAVHGRGTFAMHAWRGGGGSVDVTAAKWTLVRVHDIGGDLSWSGAGLSKPITVGGWKQWTVAGAAKSVSFSGRNFELSLRSPLSAKGGFGATAHAYGSVTRLVMNGRLWIGALAPRSLRAARGNVGGRILANDVRFSGSGMLAGRIATGSAHATLRSRGGVFTRFTDLSPAKDMTVACPTTRLDGKDAEGHPIVSCVHPAGRPITAAGSDLRFADRAGSTVADFAAGIEGTVQGRFTGLIVRKDRVLRDPAGFNRWFLVDALSPAPTA